MPVELEWDAARASAATLAGAGTALTAAGFDERAVCSFYGVPLASDAQYVLPPPGRARRGLGAAIALWVGGEEIERQAVPMIDDEQLRALRAIGLLDEVEGTLVARISITPFRGALVAADRADDTAAASVRPPDLSAWNLGASLPPVVPSLLDTGCGAGAILLSAARRGARVVGTEVDERALAFARLNLALNGIDDRSVTLLEADVRDGLPTRGAPFACAVFNAPLVRAPLAVETPLYLYAPGAEVLPLSFLACSRGAVAAGGEALCHTQLTEEIWSAALDSGFDAAVGLRFATAPDGTPHALVSLRESDAIASARFLTPLGPALPHLGREPIDRLHAAARMSAFDADALASAVLRPAPWLELVHAFTHDGFTFRRRTLQLGGQRLEPADLTLLERCDGRPLAEAAPDPGMLSRAQRLLALGLLVP